MQIFYTVQPNDTLFLIANRWGIPVDSLIAANQLTPPYTIYIGQQLSVPPGVNVYRVRQGDSVYAISQRFRVPISVIIAANQLRPPYQILVGQLLRIPPGVPYYIVQPGDTLFEIARRFNVVTKGKINYDWIREINQLPSYDVLVGQRLVIPYAPPGENGILAFFANVTGEGYDLWLYNPGNGAIRQVSFSLGEDFSIPYWSPDNSKIAFVGREGILFIVSLIDGTVIEIDQFVNGLGVFVNWSSDARKIAYINGDDIILYHVDTHQVQLINQPGASDVQWFPSDNELLFQAPDENGISQLYRMLLDGTGMRQITRNTGSRYNHVRLSPNGEFVLYTTPGASISLIYTIDLSTGNVYEVKGGPLAKNYFPTWSIDSNAIAFSATAFEDVGYFSQIRTVDRQGSSERVWAISDCFSSPVSWTSDGKNFTYVAGCQGQGMGNEIWMLNMNHPVPIQLVSLQQGNIVSFSWSMKPIPHNKRTFTSERFQVQLQYPAHWQKVTEERFEGVDGFFQISAIASEMPLHEICQMEAFHRLLPYGSDPRIDQVNIQGMEACFIYPSADQPLEMQNQAALIVRYPKPVVITDTVYQFFILWANQQHINEMARTIQFI